LITTWQPAEQAGRTAARLSRRQGGLAAAAHPAVQGRRLPRCSAPPRASTPAAKATRCQPTGPAAAVSAAGRARGLQSPAGAGMTKCISSTRAQLPCRELTAATRCCRATQHTAHLHGQASGGSARAGRAISGPPPCARSTTRNARSGLQVSSPAGALVLVRTHPDLSARPHRSERVARNRCCNALARGCARPRSPARTLARLNPTWLQAARAVPAKLASNTEHELLDWS